MTGIARIDLDHLLHRVDSRYRLVLAAARRARQLADPIARLRLRGRSPAAVALEELAAGTFIILREAAPVEPEDPGQRPPWTRITEQADLASEVEEVRGEGGQAPFLEEWDGSET